MSLSASISDGLGSQTGFLESASVEDSLNPLSGEIVPHDPSFEALKPQVFYLVKAVVIEDGDKCVVVCDDSKVWQAC